MNTLLNIQILIKCLTSKIKLLFARTGDGKTATRLRLQTFYRVDVVADQHVFAFSYLIPQEIADQPPYDLYGHLQSLLTTAVSHLFVFLTLRGLDLPALRRYETAIPLAPAALRSTFINIMHCQTPGKKIYNRRSLIALCANPSRA